MTFQKQNLPVADLSVNEVGAQQIAAPQRPSKSRRLPVWLALIGLLLAFVFEQPQAQAKKLGLGFQLGAPSGLNAKYWLSNRTAVNAVVGWNSAGFNNPSGYYRDACYDNSYYKNNRLDCDRESYRYYDRRGSRGWDVFHIHADYLIHNFSAIRASVPVPIYYGIGAQYENLRDYYYGNRFGPRGTFGIAIIPRTIPFDFFIELSPVLWLLPDPDFDVYGGIGARFWF